MPRNSSGVYALPAGNPVVANTLIETNWANPTMSDLGAAITDSLDRYGRGTMLAAFKIQDGAVGSPGLAFGAEPSSGLYRNGAGTLALAILGIAVATFNASGVAVAGTLAVSGATTLTGAVTMPGGITTSSGLPISGGNLKLDDARSVAWGDGSTYLSGNGATDVLTLATAATERLRIDAIGNVAIGSAAPEAKLDILGSAPGVVQAILTRGSSDGNFRIVARNGATGTAAGIEQARLGVEYATGGGLMAGFSFLRGVSSYDGALLVYTNNTERMRIDSAGKVGIGIAAAYNLHVAVPSGDATVRVQNAGQAVTQTISGADSYFDMTAAGAYIWRRAGFAESMRIDSAGNVSIGNSTAGVTGLAIGSGARTGDSYFRNTTSTNDLYFGQSAGMVFGQTSGNIGLLLQVGAKPLGIGSVSNQPIVFGVNNAEIARMDAAAGAANLYVGASSSLWSAAGRGLVQASGSTNAIFGLAAGSGRGYVYHDGNAMSVMTETPGALSLGTAGVTRMTISAAGQISDAVAEIGWKGLPQNVVTGVYTLVAGDRGKHVVQNAVAGFIAPANVFNTPGDAITLINNCGSPVSLVQGAGLTMFLGGTASTGNRSLATGAMVTVLYLNSTLAYVSGAGIS